MRGEQTAHRHLPEPAGIGVSWMTTEMTAGRDRVEAGLGYVDEPLVRGSEPRRADG